MPPEPTYYVQISDPEEPERWHTVARVEGRELASMNCGGERRRACDGGRAGEGVGVDVASRP